MKKSIFTSFIIFAFSLQIHAQADYLQGQFWAMEYKLEDFEFSRPLDLAQMQDEILTEADYFFSGIIYGYNFRYQPYDRTHQIREEFEFSQIAKIIDTNKGKIIQQEFSQDRLNALVGYSLSRLEMQKHKIWSHHSNEDANGYGESSIFEPDSSKHKAFENACREAIRALLREKLKNKPGEVSGKFSLKEVPRFYITSGNYACSVKLLLKVENVESIGIY